MAVSRSKSALIGLKMPGFQPGGLAAPELGFFLGAPEGRALDFYINLKILLLFLVVVLGK